MTQSRPDVRRQQRAIAPFWDQLHFFFSYPFRTGPLITMGVLLAGATLAGLIGLVAGPLATVLKGALIYAGLRYGFKILDLFRLGHFEGESVESALPGPESRPAKMGLVIVLFIALVVIIGNAAVGTRLADDPAAQAMVIDRFERAQRQLLAQRERATDAISKRRGIDESQAAATDTPQRTTPSTTEGSGTGSANDDSDTSADARSAAGSPGDRGDRALASRWGTSRAALIEANLPKPGEALWARLLPVWFWPMVIALSFLLPAATLVIAIDDQFFKALNPTYVPYFVGAMGSAYFVLWGFYLLIVGVRGLVARIGESWPSFVQFPLELGLGTYLAWVLCALLGYTLYQFHQELHLDVDVDFDTHRKAGGADKIAAAGSAQAAIHAGAAHRATPERKLGDALGAGRGAGGVAELKSPLRQGQFDPDLQMRLHARHVELGVAPAAPPPQGAPWLSGLAKEGRMREALAALRTLRMTDTRFLPGDADITAALAVQAMEEGEFELAAMLVDGFSTRFPKHAQGTTMVFIGGRILSEHRRDDARAAQVMRGLIAHDSRDPVAERARRYLARLEAKAAGGNRVS